MRAEREDTSSIPVTSPDSCVYCGDSAEMETLAGGCGGDGKGAAEGDQHAPATRVVDPRETGGATSAIGRRVTDLCVDCCCC